MPTKTPDMAGQDEELMSAGSLPTFADLEKEFQQEIKTAKKTRKKKEPETDIAEEPAPSEGIKAEDIEEWCAFPLDAVFLRTGKDRLSNIERKAWSRSTAKIVNKYLPLFAEKWEAEIGWTICIAVILMSRYSPPFLKKPEPEPEKTEETKQKEMFPRPV